MAEKENGAQLVQVVEPKPDADPASMTVLVVDPASGQTIETHEDVVRLRLVFEEPTEESPGRKLGVTRREGKLARRPFPSTWDTVKPGEEPRRPDEEDVEDNNTGRPTGDSK